MTAAFVAAGALLLAGAVGAALLGAPRLPLSERRIRRAESCRLIRRRLRAVAQALKASRFAARYPLVATARLRRLGSTGNGA